MAQQLYIVTSFDKDGKQWYWTNGWGTAIAQRHHASEMTKDEADKLVRRLLRTKVNKSWKPQPV